MYNFKRTDDKSYRYAGVCEGVNNWGIECLKQVSQKVKDYSTTKFGKILCWSCQSMVKLTPHHEQILKDLKETNRHECEIETIQ